MQFVIWGNGKMGKRLLNYLGNESVAAFIDSSAELQNTTYQDVPVIDYDTYKKQFIGYPIIVSPKKAEKEILTFLHNDGIWWSFPFISSEYAIGGLLRQAPLDMLTKDYSKSQPLCIYGLGTLGLIVYDYFCRKGYNCRLLLQSSICDEIRADVGSRLGIQTETICKISRGQRVLLAAQMEAPDAEVLQNKAVIERYYDLDVRKSLYYYPTLEKFKNKHEGDRGFIVATGPSLQMMDLDKLHESHAICISVNGIFKAFHKTEWRPDYYITADPLATLFWHNEILQMDVAEKFISDLAWCYDGEEAGSNMHKWHLQPETITRKGPKFSDDFSRISYLGNTSVYDGALQLAAYMGFKEIYLLGTDCVQYDDPQKQHFVSDYAPAPSNLVLEDIMLAYQSAKRYADAHGIKIYNATRGGALEIFERVDFDSLFEK